MEYILSHWAIDDLHEIWSYTVREWSTSQANKYYHELLSGIQLLTTNPLLYGRPYPPLGVGVRGFRVKRHVIFFRLNKFRQRVEVLRIIHESRDIRPDMIHLDEII